MYSQTSSGFRYCQWMVHSRILDPAIPGLAQFGISGSSHSMADLAGIPFTLGVPGAVWLCDPHTRAHIILPLRASSTCQSLPRSTGHTNLQQAKREAKNADAGQANQFKDEMDRLGPFISSIKAEGQARTWTTTASIVSGRQLTRPASLNSTARLRCVFLSRQFDTPIPGQLPLIIDRFSFTFSASKSLSSHTAHPLCYLCRLQCMSCGG